MLNYLVSYIDFLLVSQIKQLFDIVFNTMTLVKFFFSTFNPILLCNQAKKNISTSPSIISTCVPCWIICLIACRSASHFHRSSRSFMIPHTTMLPNRHSLYISHPPLTRSTSAVLYYGLQNIILFAHHEWMVYREKLISIWYYDKSIHPVVT